MKKKLIVFVAIIGFGFNALGQCVEVKGVQDTIVICEKKGEMNEMRCYAFKNKNNYTVTIEAEQIHKIYDRVEKKNTFIVEAGKEYIWKESKTHNLYINGYFLKFKVFKCP